MDALSGLGINFGYLLLQVASFLIMLLVLVAWVYKPLVDNLEKRKKNIEKGLEDARVAAEARAQAEHDAENIIASARTQSAHEVAEITRRAEAQAREIIISAEEESSRIKKNARVEAEKIHQNILREARNEVSMLSMAATQKLIGFALDEKRQRSLIDEFFSGIKDGKVTILEDADIDESATVVTSALPLTDSEKEKITKILEMKLGSDADVTYKVTPEILGGLVIKSGGKVLDGSINSQLETMRKNLR